MVYMPLLEETGHMPSEKYAHAPEILAHCQRIGKQFGLYDNALFHTQVVEPRLGRGEIALADQDQSRRRLHRAVHRHGHRAAARAEAARHCRHRSFKGHSFHTSRWDYDYTGGDPAGALMDKLADKRVGIIGTGATSVQCVPHLARACKELYVFQRTPSSVDVRANAPIDPDWFSGIATPGWQQRWLENFTANQAGGTAE